MAGRALTPSLLRFVGLGILLLLISPSAVAATAAGSETSTVAAAAAAASKTTTTPAVAVPAIPQYGRPAAAVAGFVVMSLLAAAVALLLPLRVYVRVAVLGSFGWDDWTLVGSCVLFVPFLALDFWTTAHGAGQYEACIRPEDLAPLKRLYVTSVGIQSFACILARTSVAIFQSRVFGISRGVKIALYSWTVFMVVSLACTVLIFVVPCRTNVDCGLTRARAVATDVNGAISIAGDFVLALLPTYLLRTVRMGSKQKRLVGLLFAFGLLPCSFAVCRVILSYSLFEADATRSMALLTVIASLEVGSLIIYATIPALPSLFSSKGQIRVFPFRRPVRQISDDPHILGVESKHTTEQDSRNPSSAPVSSTSLDENEDHTTWHPDYSMYGANGTK